MQVTRTTNIDNKGGQPFPIHVSLTERQDGPMFMPSLRLKVHLPNEIYQEVSVDPFIGCSYRGGAINHKEMVLREAVRKLSSTIEHQVMECLRAGGAFRE